MRDFLLLGAVQPDGAGRPAGFQCLLVPHKHITGLPGMFVTSSGLLLQLAQAVLHCLKILELKLQVDYLLVPHRIHASVHVGDIGIVEAAEHMQDGIGLADIGQKLVAETLTPAGTLDKTGDVDNLHRRRHHSSGMHKRLKHLQPGIGHGSGADVGLDGTEREIGRLSLSRTYTVEKSGLADIGQTDYTAFERHIQPL